MSGNVFASEAISGVGKMKTEMKRKRREKHQKSISVNFEINNKKTRRKKPGPSSIHFKKKLNRSNMLKSPPRRIYNMTEQTTMKMMENGMDRKISVSPFILLMCILVRLMLLLLLAIFFPFQ